jgi:FMN phosphatase YigB (HAD superfamily)
MEQKIDALIELDQKIKKENVLFFDLDDTLINTNYANFLSYMKAIEQITLTNINISYNPNERFNREKLIEIIPLNHTDKYDKIILLKDKFYITNLSKTTLNNDVAKILMKYYQTHKTFLISNSREERGALTLEHHDLTNKFSAKFYRKNEKSEDSNKYKFALASLKISPDAVIVFENDELEINAAVLSGIPQNNIIKI